MVGVINDYVEFATNCLDRTLHFELVGFDSQEEQLQALKEGQIDLIFHISQNPYYAEQNKVALSNTVLTIPLAAVTTQGYFDENAQNTVAVEKRNCKFRWYIPTTIQIGRSCSTIHLKTWSALCGRERQTVLLQNRGSR
ncbi:hypothetical protein [Brotaphodocola sp.]|uniref:hypothetical protein n=1 Tax=Brotaphodocola sp. TaxID=3073577 RepID=UPI003D7D24A0